VADVMSTPVVTASIGEPVAMRIRTPQRLEGGFEWAMSPRLFLVSGYRFIRRRQIAAHKRCMLAATATSALFLVSYLTYHYHVGSMPFRGQGWVRPLYFAILISHTILAAAIVPLVLMTLFRAWKADFRKHARLARWTLPIWLYVSVTGVIIYVMLYQLFPPTS
jgi:putative membrane protein